MTAFWTFNPAILFDVCFIKRVFCTTFQTTKLIHFSRRHNSLWRLFRRHANHRTSDT